MHKILSTKVFLFSMFLLLLLGVSGVFAGYYYLNQKLPDLNPQNAKVDAIMDSNPVTKKPTGVTLDLSSPDDNILAFSPDILIQGKTTPESIVLVSTDTTDQTINTDKGGNFSSTFKLKEGVNNFLIMAFDNSGSSQSEQRVIYYSSDKF